MVGQLWNDVGVIAASQPSLHSLMQLHHPHSNIQIDQMENGLSLNILAAEGLVVK